MSRITNPSGEAARPSGEPALRTSEASAAVRAGHAREASS